MVDPDSSIGFRGDVAPRCAAISIGGRRHRSIASSMESARHLARQQGVSGPPRRPFGDSADHPRPPSRSSSQAAGLRPVGLIHDRRAFRLYLTDRAQPLLARMWSIAAQTREQALAGMPIQRQRMPKVAAASKAEPSSLKTVPRPTAKRTSDQKCSKRVIKQLRRQTWHHARPEASAGWRRRDRFSFHLAQTPPLASSWGTANA